MFVCVFVCVRLFLCFFLSVCVHSSLCMNMILFDCVCVPVFSFEVVYIGACMFLCECMYE